MKETIGQAINIANSNFLFTLFLVLAGIMISP
jgi:hypothetical protein